MCPRLMRAAAFAAAPLNLDLQLPRDLPSWLPRLGLLFGEFRWAWARQALHWVTAHTGAPAILVAALLIVLLYRLAKWSARFVVQVALVLTALVILTKLDVLRF